MLGAPIGVALWAVLGFFNGISQPRITVMTTALVAIVNAALNQVFIFEFGWGIAGSAWATNASMACGVGFALWMFLRPDLRRAYKTHLTWRPDLSNLVREFRLGLPMGAMYAADLFGMALFQLMQVRLGAVDGATTQVVVMLTSVSYLPGVGLALAGTTLVGQAIGAGDRDWARQLGNAVIRMTRRLHGRGGRGARRARALADAGVRHRGGSARSGGRAAGLDCCCGSPPATSSSTASTSAPGSRCAVRATSGFPLRSSWSSPGACSCRLRTCCRSHRDRAGSTGCRNSASVPWAAGSRCSPTWCCSAARSTFDGVPARGVGYASERHHMKRIVPWNAGVRSMPSRQAASRTPVGQSLDIAESRPARSRAHQAREPLERRPFGRGSRHVARPAHVHQCEQVHAGEFARPACRDHWPRGAHPPAPTNPRSLRRSASRTAGGCSSEPRSGG